VKKDFEIRKFKFSHIFRDNDDQNAVFKKTAIPILDCVIEGYNGCLMAYGQTGTGKTHTILGKRDGLLPKSLEYILSRNNIKDDRFVVDISCLQIYMENLTDLFDYKKKSIQIREKNGTFVVTNSVWVRLNNFDEAIKVLEETENRRKSCSTHMNQFSSRSHAIFIIKVTNIKNLTSSNLFLVDLAGSERIKKSYAQGSQLDEAISINTSLMALSKCIYGISENKWNHIPYRESKLTKILQETLAGNGKTVIIITISPDNLDIEETISSLKFGQRASKIYCTPKICKIENEYLTNNMFILDDQKKILEEENLHLREQCKKLLKIVESTASKSKGQKQPLSQEDCDEISKDLNSILDGDSDEQPPISHSEYQRLLQENDALKTRIDEIELEAFDNMRLTYEEVENNLYNEINEHKQTNKKQAKTISSMNKKLEELTRELETTKREMSVLKKSESKETIRSESTVSLNEDKRTHEKSDDSLSFEGQTLAAKVFEALQALHKSGIANDDLALRQRLAEVLQTGESAYSSLKKSDKQTDNIIQPQEDKYQSCYISIRSVQSNRHRGILTDLTHSIQNEVQVDPQIDQSVRVQSTVEGHFEDEQEEEEEISNNESAEELSVGNRSVGIDAAAEAYMSASQDQKAEAALRISRILEGLISDIDRRCASLNTTTMREVDALESVANKFSSSFTSFVNHIAFKALLDDSNSSRESVLKVAVNTIIENFVKRMISLRFSEKRISLLTSQNRFLKGIVFDESVREGCLEVIRRRNLSLKAIHKIQVAYKKYRWRKSYNKTQRSTGMFDWGRVRAAMGKENIQILLDDVETSVKCLQKFFLNSSPA